MLRCSGIRPISDAIRARSSTDEEVVFPAALYISSENAVPTRSLPPLHNATCASFFPYATQYTEMLSKAPARRIREIAMTFRSYTDEHSSTTLPVFSPNILDSLPGGGAEIFDDTIRNRIIRGKCTGQEWLDTVETAHNLGIRSNATMLYGHVEKPEHVVDHLLRIRKLQEKTNGFITFIPLKFSLDNTELEKNGQRG